MRRQNKVEDRPMLARKTDNSTPEKKEGFREQGAPAKGSIRYMSSKIGWFPNLKATLVDPP